MPTLIFGHPHLRLESTDSTNSHATRLIQAGEMTEGSVISAGFQTEGKGQRGAKWESSPNENLLFTLVLKPGFLKAEEQFWLSIFTSLGIHAYVTSRLASHDNIAEVRIKWPNDIYVKRHKLAGMLIENQLAGQSIRYSLIGIGLNLNSRPANSLVKAISLTEVTGLDYASLTELNTLLEFLETFYLELRSLHFSRLKQEYLRCLLGFGEMLSFREGELQWDGIIRDVTSRGQMVIEKEGKLLHFQNKEIEFLI